MAARSTAASAAARRERILQVAKAHFERFGFRRARVEDIAREAGIAKGAVYLEFPSKEVLLEAVVSRLAEEVGRRWAEEVAPLESPRERLRVSLRFTFRELGRDTLLARLQREDPEFAVLRSLASTQENERKAEAQIELIRGWVREGIARGELRADLDVEVVPFIIAALKLLHYQAELATGGRLSRERLLDGIVELFIAGLSAPAPAPQPEGTRPGRGSRR